MTQPLIHGFNIAFEDPNPIQEELGMIALPECFRDTASLAIEFVLTLPEASTMKVLSFHP